MMMSLLTFSMQADETPVLRQGAPVRMRLVQTISSDTIQPDEKVNFETLDDVKVNDTVFIPRGSTAIATITEATPKRHLARGGKLAMNIDYVCLPNGDKLALSGVRTVKAGGHTGAMIGGMVATAAVFWPAAPLFLFVEGKEAKIPDGREVTVYTNSDYKLPATQSKADERKAEAKLALHNADILKLKKAGLSDTTILAKIRTSPGMYGVGTDDLIQLKAAGLSDTIVNAMIATPNP